MEDSALISRRSVLVAGGAVAGTLFIPAIALGAPADTRITVAAGQTVTLTKTTRAAVVSIATGGVLAAPDGYSLTMTVNGVETGSVLTKTGGTDTTLAAGTYRGDIVLTVANAHPIAFGGLTFPFRQALDVGATGVVTAASVLAAVVGGKVTAAAARSIRITSTGEAFNGVYVGGGTYALQQPKIAFTGNGRCDFVGYGAAVVGTGTSTALTVEDATITTEGAVRTAVIADGGANVVVKNSKIAVADGVLPAGYGSTVDTSLMEDAPWMLGISGNCRATNLLGTGTRASYVNSSVYSQGWGALSVDNGQNGHLTAINCSVGNTGEDGYGSYAIGDATEYFLGSS